MPFYFRVTVLTVEEILHRLEEEPPLHATDVVLLPPPEKNTLSDEDSDNEDCGAKNVDSFGKAIMRGEAELELYLSDSDDDVVVDSTDPATSEINKSSDILDDPSPSASNAKSSERSINQETLQVKFSFKTRKRSGEKVNLPSDDEKKMKLPRLKNNMRKKVKKVKWEVKFQISQKT